MTITLTQSHKLPVKTLCSEPLSISNMQNILCILCVCGGKVLDLLVSSSRLHFEKETYYKTEQNCHDMKWSQLSATEPRLFVVPCLKKFTLSLCSSEKKRKKLRKKLTTLERKEPLPLLQQYGFSGFSVKSFEDVEKGQTNVKVEYSGRIIFSTRCHFIEADA